MAKKTKKIVEESTPFYDRPEVGGSLVSTPEAGGLMGFTGVALVHGSVAFTKDEYRALQKAYGYKSEKPTKKPAPPKAPELTGHYFEDEAAKRNHQEELRLYEKWKDPSYLHQAGADIHMTRHMEADGLRIVAWLAKFVYPGDDPLKTVIQFAAQAGMEIGPLDSEYAGIECDDEVGDEDDSEEDAPDSEV